MRVPIDYSRSAHGNVQRPERSTPPQAACDGSSGKQAVATLMSALGLITASLVSVCCLGTAALIALGVTAGETGILASTVQLIYAFEPYEGLLTVVAVLFIVTSAVMVYQSSGCRSDCVTPAFRSRVRWALITVALGLLLVSYGYELLR